MARRRFFVSEIRRGTAELTGADAEHLVRSLRAESGQVFEISDNRDLYLAEVETARKSLVSFRVLEKLPEPTPAVHITVVAALIKFDRFEWLIEKVTELGAAVIQPLDATRSEEGLAQAARKRHARWEKIAIEASQQSRRAHLPVIETDVRSVKSLQLDANVKLLLDETTGAPPLLSRLPQERRQSDQVALLVGPEGGWTDEERATAVENGWISCSLGNTILRAETAATAAVAILQAAWA